MILNLHSSPFCSKMKAEVLLGVVGLAGEQSMGARG